MPQVEIVSSNYVQRTLSPSDPAIDTLQGWLADPALMAPMNLPARHLDRDTVARYVASFDNKLRHLIGIFARADNAMVGYRLVEINPLHARASLHILIGDRTRWRSGVTVETMIGFYDWLFGPAGVNKVVGEIIDGNEQAIHRAKASGFRFEARLAQELRRQDTGGFADMLRFALLREDWPALRARMLSAGSGSSG